jgi:peptide subunit release factor 1 (eRF1)
LVGVGAEAMPEVAAVVAEPGPFLSVFIDTEYGVEKATVRYADRWKDLRKKLLAGGAPTDWLDVAGEWLLEHRTDGPALAFVAPSGGVLISSAIGPYRLPEDRGAWDSVAHIGPLIGWYQNTPPALVVVADRTGADIAALGRVGPLHEEVVGETGPHVHRSKPGGWSQRHYQQKAENIWRENAGQVVRRVTQLTDELDPRLVVVAGEVRAVQLMVDQLPDRVARLVRRADGSRHPGGEGKLPAEVDHLYRSAVAEDTAALVDKYGEELGQQDRGVAGVGETITALSAAAVETLLVHDDPADERRLLCSTSDPLIVASSADEIRSLGGEPEEGRLVDVLIRAAWGGGAKVRMVPALPNLAEGVGGVLRFSRSALPSLAEPGAGDS